MPTDQQLAQLYRDIIASTPFPAAWHTYTTREQEIYCHALSMCMVHTTPLFLQHIRHIFPDAPPQKTDSFLL